MIRRTSLRLRLHIYRGMHRTPTILSRLIGAAAFLLIACFPVRSRAQEPAESTGIEEISVGFSVPEVGTFILPALIDGTSAVYLPIVELFSYLRIRVDASTRPHYTTGYLFDEKRRYVIDGVTRTIDVAGKSFTLERGEMLLLDDRVYMRADFFGRLFGLYCAFNFRDLEVVLSTDFELPAVRDARRARARIALRSLFESERFDRAVPGDRSLLRLGVADWSAVVTADSSGRADVAYAIDFGGGALGGAYEVRLRGANDSLAGLSDIPWNWQYVDNDFAPARQITVGHIPSMLPDPLASSALGAGFTNRSTINRTMYGSYVIRDRTEPGWDVELFVDNRLVDFTTADKDGFYRFEIPFRYGSTNVTLRFFGPWGEEHLMERTLRIPLTMLPAGEVEYAVAGGLLNGEGAGLFGHAVADVGINSFLTLGGGVYGVEHNAPETWYPYVKGTARVTNTLFFSGRYSPADGVEGGLNWITPTQGVVELGYSRPYASAYSEPESVVEKRSIFISTDVPFDATAQFRITDIVTTRGHDIGGEGSLMLRPFGVPVTLDFNGAWSVDDTRALNANTLRAGARTLLRLWRTASLRPSIEFDLRTGKPTIGRLDVERQIVRGMWANAMLTHDFVSTGTTAQVGLRWDLPFARTSSSVRVQEGGGVYTFGASGALVYDSESAAVLAGNRGAVRRAPLTIRPFLDLNGNDVRDRGEPAVPEAEVSVSGGTVVRSETDSVVRVLGLEPWLPCVIAIDGSELPEISWRPKYRTWRVVPQPNAFQTIDVPIVVVGEASGTVLRGSDRGMQGMIVRFRQLDGPFSDSTISYEGGEFFFMGLPPGRYRAMLDGEQLRLLSLVPEISSIEFDVRSGREGDIVEGLEFRIR